MMNSMRRAMQILDKQDAEKKYTASTRRALTKYGHEACRKAYELNAVRGEGAHSIAIAHDVPGINTTRQADAAINAWAEVVKIFG